MNCLLLSRYGRLGASSRVRSYQYLPSLEAQGIHVEIAPLLEDDYLKSLYAGRPRNWRSILRGYFRRLGHLLRSHQFDLLWIEYELFPWMPSWGEWLLSQRIPYLVDYDDAVFHRYDLHPNPAVRALLARKIDKVMRFASCVIAGNDYLAERARRAGARGVELLPTVVDLNRYPVTPPKENGLFTIGWIGSPVTAHYLQLIRPALAQICKKTPARLLIVGVAQVSLAGVPAEFKEWTEETEVSTIQDFDVGVMPLPDDPWAWGKCGYKLVQYMASSRAVIASPVGMNKQLVKDNINGYLAASEEDWVRTLALLQSDSAQRERMGRAGRKMVEEQYCLQVTLPKLSSLLEEAAGRKHT